MKSIVIKESWSGTITQVSSYSPLGKQSTGAVNYEIFDIPKGILASKVVTVASTCLLPKNRFKISWDEVKNGGAIVKF